MNEEQYQKLIEAHPQAQPYIEFVRKGDGGYYRFIPFTRFDPHPNQLRARIAFGEASMEAFGEEGLKDGFPQSAMKVQERMKGKRFKQDGGEELAKKMKSALIGIAKAVEQRRKLAQRIAPSA